MSNPNFVSDLVAMAKAFEELPEIKAQLEAKTHDHDVAQQMIQRLELRLIDLKTELDAAHANTRKVEVERDHAERMFLETDDRLNAFRRLLGSFQTEAGALIASAEPEPKPEPVSEQAEFDRILHDQQEHELKHEPALQPEPGPAVGDAFTLGQGDADPTSAPTHNSPTSPTPEVATEASSAASVENTSTEAVSVQPDPTPATPDAQHSPAGSSASAGESNATTETAGSSQHEADDKLKDIISGYPYGATEASHPVDPTASSTAGDGHSSGNAEATSPVSTQADATSDDVGYHNEPKIGPAGGPEAWHEWDNWCSRMNRKYGGGSWPARPALHGDREAAAH